MLKKSILELISDIETNRKVILITGAIGSGKTLSMSHLANELRFKLPGVGGLYANYPLYGRSLSTDYVSESDRTNVICIDEITHVSKRYTLLRALENEEDNNIIFIAVFKKENLPGDLLSTVSLEIKTQRIGQDGILLTSKDPLYEEEISIKAKSVLYDAFAIPDLI